MEYVLRIGSAPLFSFGILTIVFGAVAVALLLSGALLRYSASRFKENQVHSVAEIVGYEHNANSPWYFLMVKIPELGGDTLYSVNAGRIRLEDYPKGKLIDVVYAKTKTLGIPSVEVHLPSGEPIARKRLACVFLVAGAAFLLLALALCVVK